MGRSVQVRHNFVTGGLSFIHLFSFLREGQKNLGNLFAHGRLVKPRKSIL